MAYGIADSSWSSEEVGSPGKSYNPSSTFFSPDSTSKMAPYSGYSLRAMRGLSRSPSQSRGMGGYPRMGSRSGSRNSSGFMVGSPVSQATAQRPKRLWDYSFGSLAPADSTFGKLRSMFSGSNTSSVRSRF